MYLHWRYIIQRDMMTEDLFISADVEKKLSEKHGLDRATVEQVWKVYTGITLEDDREQHKTDPATEWFLIRDSSGQILKIVFVLDDDGIAYLKSAYPLTRNTNKVIGIFTRNGGRL
jgi:hypothetical protein